MDQGFNAQAMASARNTYRKFVSLPQPPNIFRIHDSANPDAFGAPQGTTASKFPVKLGSTDPEDDKFGLRARLVDKDGVVPGVGLSVAGDDYFNYAQRKREEAMMFEFYTYIMSQADLSKPESAQWWFEKFPWMRDLRLDEIDRQAEIQKKLAKIAVTGPQSEEDFMLIYLKQYGILGDTDQPLTKLDSMKDGAGGVARNFKEGMFSIFSQKNNVLLAPYPGVTGLTDSNTWGTSTNTLQWGNPINPTPAERPDALPGFGFNRNAKPRTTGFLSGIFGGNQ